MAFMNKVILVGRICADLEPVRQAGGSQVQSFRFAVGKSKKNPQTGQWEADPNTLFIDCDAWINAEGKGAGAIVRDFAGKGKELLIEGRLQFEQWEKDGQKRSKHKLMVEQVQLLGGKDEGQGERQAPARGGYGQGGGATGAATGYGTPNEYDERNGDIPF